MRLLIILSLFTGLLSCSGYYHIKQVKKHTQKAISKGVTVERDTTYITKSDTLVEIDTLDNYIYITKTIRDTVFSAPKVVYIAKSRVEVRQENRTERKEIKQNGKTNRKQIKQTNKTKRKEAKKTRNLNWFLWGVVVGIVLTVSLFYYIRRRNQ